MPWSTNIFITYHGHDIEVLRAVRHTLVFAQRRIDRLVLPLDGTRARGGNVEIDHLFTGEHGQAFELVNNLLMVPGFKIPARGVQHVRKRSRKIW